MQQLETSIQSISVVNIVMLEDNNICCILSILTNAAVGFGTVYRCLIQDKLIKNYEDDQFS